MPRVSLFALLLFSGAASAQGAGSLVGTVTDAAGDVLSGATVRVDGTTLGAVANMSGRYRIRGVPAGTYSVTATRRGLRPTTVPDVSIEGGVTRRLELVLRATGPDDAVVAYERPVIGSDAIAAPRTLPGHDIVNLPVRGVYPSPVRAPRNDPRLQVLVGGAAE